jgi:thiamine transport system substrate-binding protein
LPRALSSGLFESYKPKGADKILPELLIDDTYTFIPFDYSYFSIIYDSEKIKDPPRSLDDLTKAEYKKSLILIDPRTSSPGLGFLTWTISTYKDKWQQYWHDLMPSVLTITPGWDTAYGLFTKGEAPLVLSYTTSPGYHLEYEQSERYRAALFEEGHPVQVEFGAILKTSPHKEAAKQFMDFMISEDFQNVIPLTNWMYTVIDIPLPESYRINTKPEKTLYTTPATEEELNEWTSAALR